METQTITQTITRMPTDTQIRIAGVIEESIVDGPGIRFVVFTQGCRHNCPGCHNPQTHAMDGGKIIEIADCYKLIEQNPLLDGITLSGGEPFEQAAACAQIAEWAHAHNLNVMTYTGYRYEYLVRKGPQHHGWGQLLAASDVLVDGRFVLRERNLLLPFRGSANQRVIDLVATRKEQRVVIAPFA